MEQPTCISHDVSLAPHTTLGVGGRAQYFASVETVAGLHDVLMWAEHIQCPVMILGGGSNILFPDTGYDGLVIQMCIDGVTYREDGKNVYVTAGAGVVLDTLIAELVEKEIWGLENLSAIPGTVGATPVQNVGAYGVEVKDVVQSVTVYDRMSHTTHTFTNTECVFGYRDSLFKQQAGKNSVVTQVTFALTRTPKPCCMYKDLQAYFGDTAPTIREIRSAIIEIRGKKFPDWNHIGTAGSFFKNPIVSATIFESLKATYPDLPGYTQENNMIKLSLGWILDKVCGLKGYTQGTVGLYHAQALVLVCEKGTSAHEVIRFSEEIIENVFQKTGVRIEREVVCV